MADTLWRRIYGWIWPFLHPVTRYVVAWAVAVQVLYAFTAWTWERRPDKERPSAEVHDLRFGIVFGDVWTVGHTDGHTTIDFGGQYAMGRMLVSGRGRRLFERPALREMLHENYPMSGQTPKQQSGEERSDAESLMWAFMEGEQRTDDKAAPNAHCLAPLAAGDAWQAATLVAAGQQFAWTPKQMKDAGERRVGGPLYPPINAFVFAPFGLLPPLYAFRLHQLLDMLWAILAGLAVSCITRRRIWWPIATTAVFLFPGAGSAQAIGQNSILLLALIAWGWALISYGKHGWGGMIWGLLAFKPVWALSFLFVLIITRRWRACLVMIATGLIQIVLTLPFVGVQSWLDWLHIGKEAAILYNVDENWVHLSRDLWSLPRVYLLDFEIGWRKRDTLKATVWSWFVLAAAFELWARYGFVRAAERRMVTGPTAAFFLLGASICCYHYMYYDYMLIVLPILLMFVAPREEQTTARHKTQPSAREDSSDHAIGNHRMREHITLSTAHAVREYPTAMRSETDDVEDRQELSRWDVFYIFGLVERGLVVAAILLYDYLTSLNDFLTEIGMEKLACTEWLEELRSNKIPVQTILALVLWLVCGWSVSRLAYWSGCQWCRLADWSLRQLRSPKQGQLGADMRRSQEGLSDEDRTHADGLQT